MVNITRLHVHYKDKRTDIMKVIKKRPTDKTSTFAIKKDLAAIVERIRSKAEYYYVVVEIDSGGEPAYRTIVPKVIL